MCIRFSERSHYALNMKARMFGNIVFYSSLLASASKVSIFYVAIAWNLVKV